MLPYRVLLQFGTQVKLRYDAFLLAQTSCYAAVPFSCTSLWHLGTDVMLRYGAFLLHSWWMGRKRPLMTVSVLDLNVKTM